ncbi:MAG: imelysin family protein [Alphaproteobacteria bacterium]
MPIFTRSLTILLLLTAAPAHAAATDEDYLALNKSVIAGHVLPRIDAFAAAAAGLPPAAENACAARDAASVKALQAAFVTALDGWEGIQHVRFGPVEFFSRGSRIFFWPDPRNSVGRQLGELLAKKAPDEITEAAIATDSVAVQGFPALERLLYDEGAAAKLAAKTPEADKACAAVRAIAANLATMAREMDAEWSEGPDAYARDIEKAGPEHVRFMRHREATLELFKSLYAAVELVADHKLARPLGASIQAARPRLAEAWRSGRSLANIRLNLRAAQDLYAGAAGGESPSAFLKIIAGEGELDELLTRAFAQTLATAEGIPGTLEAGVADAKTRPQFDKLAREVKALKSLLAQRLAPALGVPVGFNALDGD